jgi:hypothetical protein
MLDLRTCQMLRLPHAWVKGSFGCRTVARSWALVCECGVVRGTTGLPLGARMRRHAPPNGRRFRPTLRSSSHTVRGVFIEDRYGCLCSRTCDCTNAFPDPPIGTMDLVFCKRKTVPDAPCGRASCVLAAQPDHGQYEHWGCSALATRVRQLGIPLHLFGHAHYETGIRMDVGRMPIGVADSSDFDPTRVVSTASTPDLSSIASPPQCTIYSNAAMALTNRTAHVFEIVWQ